MKSKNSFYAVSDVNPPLKKITPPCNGNPTLSFENPSSPLVEILLKIAEPPPTTRGVRTMLVIKLTLELP